MKNRIITLFVGCIILVVLWLNDRPNASPNERAVSHSSEETFQPSTKQLSALDLRLDRQPEDRAAKLLLPAQDHDALLENALQREREKLPYRFATRVPIGKTTSEVGTWQRENGIATWQLEVESTGAISLNFALDEFRMPPGGEFRLSGNNGKSSHTFTSADNDDHGELWTPLVRGASAILELRIPEELLSNLRFRIAAVNHGFRGFNKIGKIGGNNSTSDSCNVDVVCDANDLSFGDQIDLYRDQIRSVGAYTLNGTDTCSGALINNANQDQTPYFLTADHCDVTTANASSVVVYWNFENSTCRPPGSSASGQDGDGDISVINTGAIFRATSPTSDFCLIELDDPVNPNSNAFFSGWNRANIAPSMAVGIHHPSVAEKRISFEYDQTTRTSYGGSGDSSTQTHIRVIDWDEGTTEGGSSGSPLFDENGFIVGQLHGGFAACGNNSSDWYGRIYSSWTGGGTNSSRLSNWLDPNASGVTTLNGIELNGGQLSIADLALSEGNSGSQVASLTVTLEQASSQTITCQATITGGSASAGVDYVDPGTQTLTFAPGSTTANYEITVNGDTTPEENETIIITLSNPANAIISNASATLTILNDDFITPVISGPSNDTIAQGGPYSTQIQAENSPTSYSISGQPTGMTVDTLSGIISWPIPITGSYTITLSASNSAGTGNGTLNLVVSSSPIVAAFEIPATVSFDQAGTYDWAFQSSTTLDGTDALVAAPPGDSSSAHLDLTINGPDQLLFFRKISTEISYDIFEVLLDGNLVKIASGEDDWAPVLIDIPSGEHTVRISYVKDSSISSGSDSVWIDRLTLSSISPPEFNSRQNIDVPAGVPVAIDPNAVFNVTDLVSISMPPGVRLNEEGHVTGIFDTQQTFTVQAINSFGSTTRQFTVNPITDQAGLAAAVGAPTLVMPSGGIHPWITQTSVTRTGGIAMRSGDISDSEISKLTTSIYGPGQLSFYWRASTEEDFDFGYIRVDGAEIAKISGISSNWQQVIVPLSEGLNEITWEYIKDTSAFSGNDAIYVDDVSLSGFAGWVAAAGVTPLAAPPSSGTDGDRNPALLEYAANESITATEPPILPAISGDPGSLTISTPVNPSATGIQINLQKSTNLAQGSWINLPPAATSPVLQAFDTSGDEKAFYRINVTSPPSP